MVQFRQSAAEVLIHHRGTNQRMWNLLGEICAPSSEGAPSWDTSLFPLSPHSRPTLNNSSNKKVSKGCKTLLVAVDVLVESLWAREPQYSEGELAE